MVLAIATVIAPTLVVTPCRFNWCDRNTYRKGAARVLAGHRTVDLSAVFVFDLIAREAGLHVIDNTAGLYFALLQWRGLLVATVSTILIGKLLARQRTDDGTQCRRGLATAPPPNLVPQHGTGDAA